MLQFIKKNYSKIGMSFALVMLVICWFQQKELNKLRTDNKNLGEHIVEMHGANVDSLRDELFNAQTQNGRYEVALELFKEKNKKGADQFELILSTQTE